MIVSKEMSAGREIKVLAGECFMPLLQGADLNAVVEDSKKKFVGYEIE